MLKFMVQESPVYDLPKHLAKPHNLSQPNGDKP